MSEKFYCDGPECERHCGAADGKRSLPPGFLAVYEDSRGTMRHFCSWDCVMRYAAEREPLEVIA